MDHTPSPVPDSSPAANGVVPHPEGAATATVTPPAWRVHRVEVWPRADQPDPRGQAVLGAARQALDPRVNVRSAAVYLIEAALDEAALARIAGELLTDPVSQECRLGISPPAGNAHTIEVHFQPGVMDPVAQSAQDAILEMLPELGEQGVEIRTGTRFDFFDLQGAADEQALPRFARAYLANPVIQDIYTAPHYPEAFAHGSPYELRLGHVALRELDDEGLARLSREGHLFLSLAEMRAIRDYYRAAEREPTDIELETLAQTWSEHCVHKTLKATIRYTPAPGSAGENGDSPHLEAPGPGDLLDRPGHRLEQDGTLIIDNLLKSTIAAATFKLMEDPELGGEAGWCVSVFKDNAGIVRFDERDGVCIKVETHNHPSALEPYGGAATGIGGCIRDVMGTGLAARPIANTDVFCVAEPDRPRELPAGVIAPKRILQQVVAGVRDYGNRMGIPTVNGAVYFHENYLANPLVFAGCVGLIPLDRCFGQAQAGDRIIVLGGRTGRDGIHGATFSSAELTDTHADEFSHAVQIGNAITQKKTLDVILQAREDAASDGACLYHAITDCGAGGFSSAVGEMGEKVGARVTLETAPLKYRGLSYTEIWISEAQERMVLAVPPRNVARLRELCAAEDVELCDLGEFGCAGEGGEASGGPMLVLTYQGAEVGRLAMRLLHEGIPMPTRDAVWPRQAPPRHAAPPPAPQARPEGDLGRTLLALLAHPNIASKHWIIRQYDHEVQGGSVVKPLVGPAEDGPSDAAVLRPKLAGDRAIALGCGLQTGLGEGALRVGEGDSYWMTLAAIDEAVRNLVCVGADPRRICLLDNFCWPSCDDPANLGALVRAAEACYDGALAYRAPFVSGKDSLNNQFTTEDGRLIAIPPTLLITALGIVPDALRCRTMDAKRAGNLLLAVGATAGAMGGSHYLMRYHDPARSRELPRVDLARGPAAARAVAGLIERSLVASAHDCADGGLLVAAAEMAFTGRIGLELDLGGVPTPSGGGGTSGGTLDAVALAFSETPSRYLLEVAPEYLDAVVRTLREAGIPCGHVGTFAGHDRLIARTPREGRLLDVPLETLRQAWMGTLDW